MSRSLLADRKNALLRRIPAITYPTPTVTAVSPATLTQTGGQTVTLTGTGFRVADGWNGYLGNVTRVLIGAYEGLTVTIVSDTSLTFVTPAMAAGTYPLWVKSNGGDALEGLISTSGSGFDILVETGDGLLTEASDDMRTE